MNREFVQELENSLYLHRPLPLHTERSLEAGFPAKKVLKTQPLCAKAQASGVTALRQGPQGTTVEAPLRADHWPEGAPPDGDYCNFGTARLYFTLNNEDWQPYNRLRFWVRPRIRGARVAHVNVAIKNSGTIPLPDRYFREGATVFDLKPNVWNECIWEFAAMPRDAISELAFYVFCSGHDIAAGETLAYDYRDIALEQVAQPEHEHGWQNPTPGIRLSTVGYWPAGQKTAIGTVEAAQFQLVDANTEAVVFEGPVRQENNERGQFAVLDFTPFATPGSYYLRAGRQQSCTFTITEDLSTESLWKVVNFFYCERCGTPVAGKHGTCHQDILAHHNGVAITFAGGWHDAGDVSQQAAQTGEVVQALFENARRCKGNTLLYLRLMEEAQWGLDFILRTRFGDGYRATSAGATRFTDNRMGNFDDIEARVHNHAFENFLFSGIEAYAADTLTGYDDALASNCLAAATADFGFAEEKFAQTGVDPAHMFEHTYNSGRSQYYAVAVWAASWLYKATQKKEYADTACQYAEKLLACQEQGAAGLPFTGFFYRDESHKTIVHFNHQSREHQFMQALDALCRTQPGAPQRPLWEQAMRRYGDYLKAIAGNTAPYGMLPAGVHKLDEAEDAETFPWLHVSCDFAQEQENYRAQLAQGKPLADGYVLRNFPVWFSFRGNAAVMLSMGKAAALLGRYFDDAELKQLGREQMYWMWGKNPFGQSLVYGAGSNYCRQYGVLCGECAGEVPVGIETLDNEDVPYWPQNNNATFREVWVGAACRWLLLCADCAAGADNNL
ncbi:MAG: glycoside hydrolase family 9 protein [Gemmiger sp.]|nr:glycoside hydrolase family 9 protein [Gemmiger sp.]